MLLFVALGGLSAWQTWSGVERLERMFADRSLALHRMAADEVRNVARFGTGRSERLDAVLRDMTSGGDVQGALLVRIGGGVRMAHGTLAAFSPGALGEGTGLLRRGEALVVHGPVRITTSGCHGGPGGCSQGCGVLCPAASDEGLDGTYRLMLATDARPYDRLRRTVLWQGLAGLLLLGGLAAALGFAARQARRAADMRQALAVADLRARHHESLSLVASGLAHEIKNPLGSLRGLAQLIVERTTPSSPEGEYASLMVDELDVITRRVDGLRHFSGPTALELRPCRPSDILRRVTTLLSPDATARGLTLDLRVPDPAPPETLADEDRLRDLMVNLIINAIEASPEQGRVRIVLDAGGSGDGDRTIHYTLTVADEGPGIPPELRSQVQKPFFTTKARGLGLGLTLAKRAVEAHDGTLEIDQTPEGGALLRARFPRRAP